MAERPSPKHLSMIRGFYLADLFTIANGVCGATAIFQSMKFLGNHDPRHVFLAFALILAAFVFDVLDGWIARWRHAASRRRRRKSSSRSSRRRAAIAFAAGVNSWLDQVILLYFTACGLSRLARFNVTAESLTGKKGKVEYFEGTPIPTSVIPLGILVLAFSAGNLYPIHILGITLHAVVLLFLLSGSLMISKTLRIPKP